MMRLEVLVDLEARLMKIHMIVVTVTDQVLVGEVLVLSQVAGNLAISAKALLALR